MAITAKGFRQLRSPELSRRNEFGRLCNERGLRFRAVEVGTDKANFAHHFLTHWKGFRLTCVDPWQTDLPGYDEIQHAYDRFPDMLLAMAVLAKFPGRVDVLRMTSPEAAAFIGKWFWPQFVYIDANHKAPYPAQDIALWWPRVADNGILAGHDYDERNHPDVVAAVNEFAKKEDRLLLITHEQTPSWYVYKDPDTRIEG